jgi:hypothetical protein
MVAQTGSLWAEKRLANHPAGRPELRLEGTVSACCFVASFSSSGLVKSATEQADCMTRRRILYSPQMRLFEDSDNDRHEKGDLKCLACEKPAKLHTECGGVLHAERRPANQADGMYIYRCDGCGEFG